MSRKFSGGTIGLFTGMSLMSIAEALYWVYKVTVINNKIMIILNLFNHFQFFAKIFKEP